MKSDVAVGLRLLIIDKICDCQGRRLLKMLESRTSLSLSSPLKILRQNSISFLVLLRTFALIVSAHPYGERKFTCHVMHGALALTTY